MVRTNWPLSSPINQKVVEALSYMRFRNSDETPEMWCARIHAPFKKILKENPGFFSKNEFIQMQGVRYTDGEKASCPVYPSNYIYCTVRM
jgi:hypothetical protein